MHKSRVFAAVLLIVGFAAAQKRTEQSVQIEAASGSRPDAQKATPEQQKYGAQLLSIAEADAAGLEGGMRAYALLNVARGYERADKSKALKLLEDALTATRTMDEGEKQLNLRARLQEQILRAVVPLAPERADELLSQVDADGRGAVLNALLGYYEKNKQLDRAIEVIYRIGQEKEIPYDAVSRVIQQLPMEKSGEATQLFTTALSSYTGHKHGGTMFGNDMGDLIVRCWRQLPPGQVKQAISELLKQADPEHASDSQFAPGNISMGSAKGAVSFSSFYEYRLFQLLPVLKQLDESEADKLLKKYQSVQSLLNQYPAGTASLNPPEPPRPGRAQAEPRRPGMTAITSDGGNGNPQAQAAMQRMMEQMSQASKAIEDSETHPHDALAKASTLSDPQVRASALAGIARVNAKKNSSIARSALKDLIDLSPKLVSQAQTNYLSSAADIYLQMGETDDAKKAVEKGIAAADKMYKDDTNADDPNQALKAYWPSAQAYRSFLRVAGQISPAWALNLLQEISDAEIKTTCETALATSWLDVPAGQSMTVSAKKNGVNMSIRNNERQ